MKRKITKTVVDGARLGEARYTIWDTELRGFGLRVNRDGSKTYVLKFVFHGRQRWHSIARHGAKTPEEARKEARRLLGLVAGGFDPAKAKADERAAETVAELCDKYLAVSCAAKKPSTIATDRGRIERHIKPLLGKKRVKDLTPNDVKRFMKAVADGKSAVDEKTGPRGRARVTGGRGTATRTVGLLGGILTFAMGEGVRSDNPVRGVKRFPDKEGTRRLSIGELTWLGETLVKAEAEGENPVALTAVRLLTLSGCRKSEILSLRWDEVDFDQGCLRLSDSKTGHKIVPLGAPALELLASIPRIEDNQYVLPGKIGGQHFVGLPKVWERIRARAKLDGVRLHDLRHSFASIGTEAGMGLPIIGKLLGHRDPKTTARYSHIAHDPAKVAADRIAGTIAAAMKGVVEDAGVVELRKRGA
jgi:integrase